MLTFLDIVKEDDFRKCVENRIRNNAPNLLYRFPSSFPLLSRYTKISDYSIKDVMSDKVTVTNIGEFNDIFDGAMYEYGSYNEVTKAAENYVDFYNPIHDYMRPALKPRDELIKNRTQELLKRSQAAFNLLDKLGVFVCCFSTSIDSTLMWSHYADYNKGMCITYDFNQWDNDDLKRKQLFPVAYLSKPIITPSVNYNPDGCNYPTEANVLCNTIIKGNDWEYENEWRLIHVLDDSKDRRTSINIGVKPKEICFGYHFIKPFFINSFKEDEEQRARNSIDMFKKLLTYMKENNIKASIIFHAIGDYKMVPKQIDVNVLIKIIDEEFSDIRRLSTKYYNYWQNQLLHDLNVFDY